MYQARVRRVPVPPHLPSRPAGPSAPAAAGRQPPDKIQRAGHSGPRFWPDGWRVGFCPTDFVQSFPFPSGGSRSGRTVGFYPARGEGGDSVGGFPPSPTHQSPPPLTSPQNGRRAGTAFAVAPSEPAPFSVPRARGTQVPAAPRAWACSGHGWSRRCGVTPPPPPGKRRGPGRRRPRRAEASRAESLPAGSVTRVLNRAVGPG